MKENCALPRLAQCREVFVGRRRAAPRVGFRRIGSILQIARNMSTAGPTFRDDFMRHSGKRSPKLGSTRVRQNHLPKSAEADLGGAQTRNLVVVARDSGFARCAAPE